MLIAFAAVVLLDGFGHFILAANPKEKSLWRNRGKCSCGRIPFFEIWPAVDSLDEVFFLFSREKAAFLAFLLSKNRCLLLYNLF